MQFTQTKLALVPQGHVFAYTGSLWAPVCDRSLNGVPHVACALVALGVSDGHLVRPGEQQSICIPADTIVKVVKN